MSELDKALDRLGEAVASLADASKHGLAKKSAKTATRKQVDKLTTERDRLQAEVDEFRARHDEDTRLHEEATEAVKSALTDLRSLVASQEQAG
jgi:hypothetical protein